MCLISVNIIIRRFQNHLGYSFCLLLGVTKLIFWSVTKDSFLGELQHWLIIGKWGRGCLEVMFQPWMKKEWKTSFHKILKKTWESKFRIIYRYLSLLKIFFRISLKFVLFNYIILLPECAKSFLVFAFRNHNL